MVIPFTGAGLTGSGALTGGGALITGSDCFLTGAGAGFSDSGVFTAGVGSRTREFLAESERFCDSGRFLPVVLVQVVMKEIYVR